MMIVISSLFIQEENRKCFNHQSGIEVEWSGVEGCREVVSSIDAIQFYTQKKNSHRLDTNQRIRGRKLLQTQHTKQTN